MLIFLLYLFKKYTIFYCTKTEFSVNTDFRNEPVDRYTYRISTLLPNN